MKTHWKIQSMCKSRSGDVVNINSVHTDITSQRKLQNLGIRNGEEVCIINGEENCSYLIETDLTQVMLDWDTVKQIRVKVGVS